jgi:glucosyl-3-phosphoglycerate synthase
MQRFHHSQFGDFRRLSELKSSAAQRVSVCIPTLNEAETIGGIVSSIRSGLMENHGLVDEILVIDSGSTDATLAIARNAGATALLSSEIAPHHGSHLGKGENLWKALHLATGDIICYIDGDISNFHPGFVAGLLGPLLTDSDIGYVKAFYERPLDRGESTLSSGGGRVSEILIRPLVSLFYPELSAILQPLAGEYAARRPILESLPFPTGYGVEIAHLIDLASAGKLAHIAQTDLVKRVHRNRDDDELGHMAFAILKVVIRRLERDGKLHLTGVLPDLYQSWILDGGDIRPTSRHIPEPERAALSQAGSGNQPQAPQLSHKLAPTKDPSDPPGSWCLESIKLRSISRAKRAE